MEDGQASMAPFPPAPRVFVGIWMLCRAGDGVGAPGPPGMGPAEVEKGVTGQSQSPTADKAQEGWGLAGQTGALVAGVISVPAQQ